MFELDLRSRLPLFEQIIEKFKELIIGEVLKPNEQLPPVRTISKEISVNPNTIQKAYKELEVQGYIYSIKGKGSFVTPSFKINNKEKVNLVKKEIAKILSEAMYLGVTKDEIIEILKNVETSVKGDINDDRSKERK